MTDSQRLQHRVQQRGEAIYGTPALREMLSECLRNQYAAAKEILGDRSNPNRIGELCGEVLTFLEGRAQRSPLRPHWACRAGCAFCCVTRVDVHVPQAVEIAEFLRERLSPAEREELRGRLAERVRQISKMTPGEHSVARLPCVFLQANSACMIHSVRPLKCAAFYSCSAEKCEEAVNHMIDGAVAVPSDMTQTAVGEGVAAGLGLAFCEMGLDHWVYELQSAVLRAIDTPAAGEKWLAGELLFRSCISRGAEANSTVEKIREAKAEAADARDATRLAPAARGRSTKSVA